MGALKHVFLPICSSCDVGIIKETLSQIQHGKNYKLITKLHETFFGYFRTYLEHIWGSILHVWIKYCIVIQCTFRTYIRKSIVTLHHLFYSSFLASCDYFIFLKPEIAIQVSLYKCIPSIKASVLNEMPKIGVEKVFRLDQIFGMSLRRVFTKSWVSFQTTFVSEVIES